MTRLAASSAAVTGDRSDLIETCSFYLSNGADGCRGAHHEVSQFVDQGATGEQRLQVGAQHELFSRSDFIACDDRATNIHGLWVGPFDVRQSQWSLRQLLMTQTSALESAMSNPVTEPETLARLENLERRVNALERLARIPQREKCRLCGQLAAHRSHVHEGEKGHCVEWWDCLACKQRDLRVIVKASEIPGAAQSDS